jgi:hypothetical protein
MPCASPYQLQEEGRGSSALILSRLSPQQSRLLAQGHDPPWPVGGPTLPARRPRLIQIWLRLPLVGPKELRKPPSQGRRRAYRPWVSCPLFSPRGRHADGDEYWGPRPTKSPRRALIADSRVDIWAPASAAVAFMLIEWQPGHIARLGGLGFGRRPITQGCHQTDKA